MSVCSDQSSFNDAVKKALDKYSGRDKKGYKIAMITIQQRLEKEHSESLMIMQVHDELVFDAPASEIEALAALVKEEMEGAYKLHVPLKADITVGETWYKN